MSEGIRRSFDAIAEAYAREFADELERKPFDRDLLTAFASTLPAGASVLDIGTGAAAHVGRFLANRGADVTGVDLSERVIEVARQLNPGMQFLVADFRALPQADATIDAVTAFHCFIYGSDEDIGRGLAEARRILRPGGRLLAAVHGAIDDRSAEEPFGDFKGTPIDIVMRHTTPAAFASLAEGAGLRIDELRVREPYPFEHRSRRVYLLARAP